MAIAHYSFNLRKTKILHRRAQNALLCEDSYKDVYTELTKRNA